MTQHRTMLCSESVTAAHPDKLCDQISDAIVDRFLRQDPSTSLVVECALSTGIVFLSAKYQSAAKVDLTRTARSVIDGVGYSPDVFDARTCTVMMSLHETQMNNLTTADTEDWDRVVARDPVTAFGFACTHTASLMPLPIALAHRLARRCAAVRTDGDLAPMAPDAKTQVGVEFEAERPRRIHTIAVLTSQAGSDAPSQRAVRDHVMEQVIKPVFHDEEIQPDDGTRVAINPEGPLVPGGPRAHAGLTGRKNATDTYGGFARHSSSALSGKDPSRIDRTAAYAARHAAKNVVAAGLAGQCEVQVSYTVGLPAPVSLQVLTAGTGRVPDEEIAERVERVLDFRVAAIASRFRLHRLPEEHPAGFYRRLAAYGHFGREDVPAPWEAVDVAEALR
jgi:S-adenosylmethionine synthetase